MAVVTSFSDEQSRVLLNLAPRYEAWMHAERTLLAMPYDLRRKEIGGRAYLYEIGDRGGNGKSLGRWSEVLAETFALYRERKAAAKHARRVTAERLDESSRLYRALRLPMLSAEAGKILREADRRGLLGADLIVIGTNATAAYALEANGIVRDLPDETEDFDLAWAAEEAVGEQRVWEMLKAVDPTFAVNSERTFQVRNARAYEVELLVAPSRAETMARTDRPRPIPLPEQEWLLRGRRVDHVVACRDGSPARIVAPDPRWFALQKLWLSEQPKRNPLKRPKDSKQGTLLLDAITEAMPQFPLDAAFRAELPVELAPLFLRWRDRAPPKVGPVW